MPCPSFVGLVHPFTTGSKPDAVTSLGGHMPSTHSQMLRRRAVRNTPTPWHPPALYHHPSQCPHTSAFLLLRQPHPLREEIPSFKQSFKEPHASQCYAGTIRNRVKPVKPGCIGMGYVYTKRSSIGKFTKENTTQDREDSNALDVYDA